MYIVYQDAVYRHKIMGVYDTIARARSALEQYYNLTLADEHATTWWYDFDGHHSYMVGRIGLNEIIDDATDVGDLVTFMPTKKLEEPPGMYEYTWSDA